MLIEELKYIIQSAHINFLYGSGVSRPYLITLGNIEDYLTQLEKDKTLKEDTRKILKASIYKTYSEGVIIPNYVFPLYNADFVKTTNAYNEFFHIWNDLINKRSSLLLDKQINLFTTNIDLLVEHTLANTGLELNDGFRGTLNPIFDETNFQISLSKSSMQYHKSSEIPIFNLMKIHGAVNWDETNGCIQSDIFRTGKIEKLLHAIPKNNFVTLTKTDSEGNIVNANYDELVKKAESITLTDSNVFDKFFEEYEKIVMINPTKEKFRSSVMDYHFYELMRIFSNSLERENSVLFVMGFSFADEHIAQIVKRAAATNPTLQVIIFAYSDNDANDYTHNLDISAGGVNNNITVVTPKKFKEDNSKSDRTKSYKDLLTDIEHFDLTTINKVFNQIAVEIHSPI